MEDIKTSDVMLGNLMQDQDGNILQISEITEKNIVYKVLDRTKFPLKEGWKAVPIPLSEEILLKAGFVEVYKSDYTQKLEHEECISFVWKRVLNLNDGTIYFMNICIPNVRCLHQLQNLFKSLTGNDLKIEI